MEKITIQNLDTLSKCAEQVNNIFTIVYKVAVIHNYPAFGEIVKQFEEVNKQIFLLQNFLISPESENIIDAVLEQHKQSINYIKTITTETKNEQSNK
jgi:hypothetical protein